VVRTYSGQGRTVITPSLWLITAHLIGDFPLQPDWIAKYKTENKIRLSIHVLIHAFLVIPIAWRTLPNATSMAIFISWVALSHGFIDHRRWVEPKEGWGETWVWLNDQIFHLAALSLAYPIASLGT